MGVLKMTSTSFLICFLAASLASVAILAVILGHRLQVRWMRIFCEKSGIPATSMEASKPTKEVAQPEPKKKVKAFSVPIPGAPMFKSK